MSVKDFQTMTIEEKSLWFVRKLVDYKLKVGDR